MEAQFLSENEIDKMIKLAESISSLKNILGQEYEKVRLIAKLNSILAYYGRQLPVDFFLLNYDNYSLLEIQTFVLRQLSGLPLKANHAIYMRELCIVVRKTVHNPTLKSS